MFLPVAIYSHLQVAKVEPRPQATAGEFFERSQKSQIKSDRNGCHHASGAARPPSLPATSFSAVLQFWEPSELSWSY